MKRVRYTFVFLVAAIAAGNVAAWAPATASTGGVGPAPGAPLPPAPSPSASSPTMLHPPNVRIVAPHVFISEGSYLVDQSVNPPSATADVLSRCGAPPKWRPSVAANLKSGYASEKAYFQENDKFASPGQIGFIPETPDRVCVAYYVTVGHYTGDLAASVFFITARHRTGGPMYCITSIGGALPAGEFGVSSGGGPILSPDQCAALPVFVPTNYTPIMAPQPFPMPTASAH